MKTIDINIDASAINPVYLPFLDCKKRYLVLYGGAGSGKSYFIAQRIIIKLLSSGMTNLLCVRAVGNTHRDSTFALLRQIISAWEINELFTVNLSELRIVCRYTQNSVIFKGLDDAEKLKSLTFAKGDLTDIWIEEASEINESDFNQLDVRLRGRGEKQIVLSFNPVDVNHWLKKRFFDRRDENAAILHTTYKDNVFLDGAYSQILESYKDTDRYYYDVYCLGQWGVYGKTVFDAGKVQDRINNVPEPGTRYIFENGEPIAANDGYIIFYEKPIPGVPYVIGADTAGEGSDFFAAHVIDNVTGRQAAVLHKAGLDESVFAYQLYCLGKYYNEALIGAEANFSTYPIKKLEEWGYENQYVRESEDTFTHSVKKSFGFRTTALTRPLIIAGLVDIVRESPELINDKATLEEMLTFVRNEKGRPEAMSGAHDDLVMSLAITYYIRGQQKTAPEPVRAEKACWDATMYEDYYAASDADREYLIKKWGNPFEED